MGESMVNVDGPSEQQPRRVSEAVVASKDASVRREGWSFRFEMIVAFATAVGTASAVLGSCFVHRQLKLMEESNQATRDSVRLAERSSAEGSAETAKALELAERSAKAAESAAAAAQTQSTVSERTLTVTERSISNRERPWVFATDSRGLPNLSPPTTSTVSLQIKNLGSLPATNVVVFMTHMVGRDWFKVDPTPPPWKNNSSTSIVGPGDAVTADITLEKDELERQGAERVLKGEVNLYIYGWVRYTDPLRRVHTMRFCRRYLPSGGDRPWSHCNRHNDTN